MGRPQKRQAAEAAEGALRRYGRGKRASFPTPESSCSLDAAKAHTPTSSAATSLEPEELDSHPSDRSLDEQQCDATNSRETKKSESNTIGKIHASRSDPKVPVKGKGGKSAAKGNKIPVLQVPKESEVMEVYQVLACGGQLGQLDEDSLRHTAASLELGCTEGDLEDMLLFAEEKGVWRDDHMNWEQFQQLLQSLSSRDLGDQ